MAIIIHPRRWGSSPPAGYRIRRGHPLAQGMIGCFALQEGGGIPSNLASPGILSGVNTPTYGANQLGSGISTGTTSYYAIPSGNVPTGGTYFSNYILGQFATTGTTRVAWRLGGDNNYHCGTDAGTGNRWHLALTGVVGIYMTSFVPTAAQPYGFGLSYTRGVSATFNVWNITNRSRTVETIAEASTPGSGGTVHALGGYDGALGLNWNSTLNMVLFWNRLVGASEFEWLNAEPFAFLSPPAPAVRYFVPVASSNTARNGDFNISLA